MERHNILFVHQLFLCTVFVKQLIVSLTLTLYIQGCITARDARGGAVEMLGTICSASAPHRSNIQLLQDIHKYIHVE